MRIPMLVSVLLAVVLCLFDRTLTAVDAAFLSDPAFNNLKYFGPNLTDHDWKPRDMALIGDYTWRINNLTLEAGAQCLFVNLVLPAGGGNSYIPDWKNSKLGSGRSPTQLLIGGGNIQIKQTGSYRITIVTPNPSNPLVASMEMTGIDLYPAPIFTPTSGGFVQSSTSVNIVITFPNSNASPHPFNYSQITRDSFSSVVVPPGAAWSVVTGTTSATVQFTGLSKSMTTATTIISLTLAAGVITDPSNGRPNTAGSYQFLYEPYSGPQPKWYSTIKLRDDTNLFTDSKPAPGGWYVTPIHIQVMSRTGQVLITGWSRRQDVGCNGFGSRVHGATFKIDPISTAASNTDRTMLYTVASAGGGAQTLSFTPIHESPRFTGNPSTTPIQSADVMYCSGHAPLGDGRKLYVGGAHYWDVSTANEKEFGLNYGRVYDPSTGLITQIPWNFTGTAWYPTVTLLPNRNVLITRGFTDFCSPLPAQGFGTTPGGSVMNPNGCCGDSCASPGIILLNRAKLDAGAENPWSMLFSDAGMTPLINPAVTDYTRTFVLQTAVMYQSISYDVAMFGKAGRIVLVNSETGQFAIPPGGQRPSSAGCGSDSSANSGVLAPTGEIVIVGPCSLIDIYNPATDSWRTPSLDSGIPRTKSATVLLPTGAILIINGENPNLDQSSAATQQPAGDPRYAQLLDIPSISGAVSLTTLRTLEVADETGGGGAHYRGYHSVGALMKDGSILIGGGTSNQGGIGCEHSHLRLVDMPYLPKDDATVMSGRLEIVSSSSSASTAEPWVWYQRNDPTRSNIGYVISYRVGTTGKLVRTTRGVALLAVAAFTHGGDQNQRYIELPLVTGSVIAGAAGAVTSVTVTLPSSPALFPGEYLLFLVNTDGVPSVAQAVQVVTEPPVQLSAAAPTVPAAGFLTFIIAFVSIIVARVMD